VAQASFDVAVVGGGSAGLAAAVSAARIGSRTLLVERSDLLGGNASLAYVHTICGLFAPADAGDANWIHPGFPRRFALGLRDAGAAAAPERAALARNTRRGGRHPCPLRLLRSFCSLFVLL